MQLLFSTRRLGTCVEATLVVSLSQTLRVPTKHLWYTRTVVFLFNFFWKLLNLLYLDSVGRWGVTTSKNPTLETNFFIDMFIYCYSSILYRAQKRAFLGGYFPHYQAGIFKMLKRTCVEATLVVSLSQTLRVPTKHLCDLNIYNVIVIVVIIPLGPLWHMLQALL
eukprot:sb/3472524/